MTAPAAWGARRAYFVVSLLILALDQLTKLAADRLLRDRAAVEIVPDFFNLWYSRNPGGLFGSFRDWPGPVRFVLLTVLPVVAVGLIASYLARTRAADRPTLWGLSLILGGAAGNLIDRVLRGEVIDFLDVYVPSSRLADWLVARFGTAHWPTFNLADSAIVSGVGLLLLGILRSDEASATERRLAEPTGHPANIADRESL